MCATFIQNSYNPFHSLQKHTAGKLRGRSEIRAFPAAVCRPTAVNTFNTTYCMKKGGKEEKKIASLSLFGATFMFKAHTMSVSWVSCFYVTPWTIHFADFNLHAKWDWGFSSDADGDLISRRLNLRLQLVLSGPNILPGLSRVITHTLGWAQQLINIDPKANCAEMKTGKLCALVRKLVSLLHSPSLVTLQLMWMKCAGSS